MSDNIIFFEFTKTISTRGIHKIRYSPPKYLLYRPSGFLEPLPVKYLGNPLGDIADIIGGLYIVTMSPIEMIKLPISVMVKEVQNT